MRDIYLNGLNKEDFKELNNLKSVSVWTWGLSLDLKFNEKVSEERLYEIVDTLKASENIESIGYTSNEWIGVTINNRFYDQFMENNLTLEDIVENQLSNVENITIELRPFTPIELLH